MHRRASPSAAEPPPSSSVHDSVVADAGGLLVLAGLLEGLIHETDEILSLDATALLVAEYLAVHHEGAPDRARVDYGAATRVVREWFPVRSLAIEAALTADPEGLDGAVALRLAESLGVALVTKNRQLASRMVPVLHC